MVIDVGVVKSYLKPKADTTLYNMRKVDLIEYIRTLEHNYNVAVSFNANQAKYIESLDIAQKWIPVTERLPEEMRAVIVWTKYRERGEAMLAEDGFEWCESGERSDVTHWMYYPEPPEEAQL